MSGDSPRLLNGERSVDTFLTTTSNPQAASASSGGVLPSSMVAVGQFLAREDTKSSLLTFGACEYDHMYASVETGLAGNEPNSEVRHLKELLLLHLDVIQQQSEQLVTKEKTITNLRQENETLRQRLERMDRRVSLQKSKADGDSVDNCVPTTIVVETISSNQQLVLPLPSALPIDSSPLPSSVGNESIDNDQTDTKRRRRGVPMDTTPVASALPPPPPPITSTPVTRRKRSISEAELSFNSRGRRGRRNSIPILTTTQHYFTIVGTNGDLDEPFVPADGICEVPRWRVKTYEPLHFSGSGANHSSIERLDDEIFAKRHLRHEQDERRRKRWDVQRLREQRQIEKLKQKSRTRSRISRQSDKIQGSCSEDNLGSLYPQPEDAQYLEVTDRIPVSAFGNPLSEFTSSEFSLPWLNKGSSSIETPTASLESRRRHSDRR